MEFDGYNACNACNACPHIYCKGFEEITPSRLVPEPGSHLKTFLSNTGLNFSSLVTTLHSFLISIDVESWTLNRFDIMGKLSILGCFLLGLLLPSPIQATITYKYCTLEENRVLAGRLEEIRKNSIQSMYVENPLSRPKINTWIVAWGLTNDKDLFRKAKVNEVFVDIWADLIQTNPRVNRGRNENFGITSLKCK